MTRLSPTHVSLDQAAHILAISKRTLMELMASDELRTVRGRGRQGRLLRSEVETYAAGHFRPRRYSPSDSHFMSTAGVADVFGVSRPRVIQFGEKGSLLYLVAISRLARGFGSG